MNEQLNTNDKFAFIVMAIVVVLLGAFYAEFLRPSSGGDTIYVTEANIFRTCFKEPFERIVFLMRDGNSLTYTTHHEHSIRVNFAYFRQSIKKRGYETRDIIYCVHNHLISPRFSEADIRLYRYMRGDGFTGIFALYHQPTKRIIPYEEN